MRSLALPLSVWDSTGMTTSLITPLHVERGRQMRAVLEHDVTVRGLSADQAVTSLAAYLGIDAESVRLAVAIANDADNGDPL